MFAAGPSRVLDLARWLALAWLATLWFQAWPLARPGGSPLFACDVLLAMAWALAGAAVLLRHRGWRTIDWPIVAGCCCYLLSQLLSLGGRASASGVMKLVAFAPMVLSPVLLLWLFPDRDGVRRVIRAVGVSLVGAVAVGLVTIGVFYVDRPTAEASLMCNYGALQPGPYPRLCAPFLNPNMLANFLTAAVPTVAAAVALRWGAWRGLALAAVATVVAVFTLSAGVGAYAIALAVSATPWLRTLRRGRLLAVVVLTGAVLVEIFLVVASFGTLVPSGEGTFSLGERDYLFWDGSRASVLSAGVRTFVENPILGVGYGSPVAHVTDPRSFVPSHKLSQLSGPVSASLQAHNIYLSIGGQSGLVGLVGFAAAIAALARRAADASRDDPSWRRLRRAALASFVCAPFVHGVFVAIEEARHFWPMLALAPLLASAAVEDRQGRAPAGVSEPT